MMIIRWFLYGVLFLVMMVLGWIFHPFYYPFYNGIYINKKVPFWWFMNSDEPTFFENKYGAVWWLKKKEIKIYTGWQKYKASYRWVAVRNPHYNLKLKLIPKLGKETKPKIYFNTTGMDGLEFCNENILGVQLATFTVEGQRQFRFSATFKLLFYTQNFQFGMSKKRYLHKVRFWNNKNVNW